MKKSVIIGGVLAAAFALQGCATQQASEAELRCAGGTLTGAAVGGFIGNQFGSGTGTTITTLAGAGVGATAGANAACN
ncbi:glycine zipper 2TM domain-containing protein [Defluviimonas sp. WL0002]|uniref:17 kDa surface antigen n=1 Tax=Albidovulum marisflavi TaxID=2984159 RepID=A0ABT2ZFA4_9RHOB|nr:glycine zipper 2TM domain-containing protein [Defluviimonas sp. WL0002]MCV2869718.1 glycine zipper 2TM domain-containing protein [Defluviimonas sp. WL0002]